MINLFILLPGGNKTAYAVLKSICGKVSLHSYNSIPILSGDFFIQLQGLPFHFRVLSPFYSSYPLYLLSFPKLVIHLLAFVPWPDIRSWACGHAFALVFTSSPRTAYMCSALLNSSLQLLSRALTLSVLPSGISFPTFFFHYFSITTHELLTFCTNKLWWLKKIQFIFNSSDSYSEWALFILFVLVCLALCRVTSWRACRRKPFVSLCDSLQCIYRSGKPSFLIRKGFFNAAITT